MVAVLSDACRRTRVGAQRVCGHRIVRMPTGPGPLCPALARMCRTCVISATCGALGGCGMQIGDLPLPHNRAAPAQIARGQQLLAQYQCGSCHVVPGAAIARGRVGPPLDGFGRRSYIAGHVPNGPEALARWIEAPAALVPDTTMPSMGVSPADARDLAAYLLALK
jgi:cytochrome c